MITNFRINKSILINQKIAKKVVAGIEEYIVH